MKKPGARFDNQIENQRVFQDIVKFATIHTKEVCKMLFKSAAAKRACVVVGTKKCAGVGYKNKKGVTI